MAVTLKNWMHYNPGVSVGGDGRWLVKWCGNRASRYPSYFEAQKQATGDCGSCDGTRQHVIVELAEPPAPQGISRSFRRMVESA